MVHTCGRGGVSLISDVGLLSTRGMISERTRPWPLPV